jgi:hypothetical protein
MIAKHDSEGKQDKQEIKNVKKKMRPEQNWLQ